jgi:hypothetical protein
MEAIVVAKHSMRRPVGSRSNVSPIIIRGILSWMTASKAPPYCREYVRISSVDIDSVAKILECSHSHLAQRIVA